MTPRDQMVALSRAVLEQVERRQAEFDGLDQIAGDGDHGTTMVLGVRAVAAAMAEADDAALGELFKRAAAAFASAGGSIGPLWGSALLRAGQALGADPDPSDALFATAAESACDGVRERGRVAEGDKTLLDVLAPAAAALRESVKRGADRTELLDAVARSAREGLITTIELVPKRGRARRFGERSVGHEDPGAASACCIIEVVCDTLGAKPG